MKINKLNIRSIKTDYYELSSVQQNFIDGFIKKYNEKTAKSKLHMENHRKHFCDWINSLCFKMSLKELIYPIIAKESSGSHFTDIDGNKYIDIAMGYGVGFHGHNPPYVTNAIYEQLKSGYELGPQRKDTAEVAELICKMTENDRVLFSATGSEAVMIAVRMARAVTGRDKVAIFKNSFHGTFDGILARDIKGDTFPLADGTPCSLVKDVKVLEYASEESLDFLRKNLKDFAAVLVEPVQSRTPELQPVEFLKELRVLTEKFGATLIFDETVTGFRVHQAGVRGLLGLDSDIVVYGKSLGGGMPISAVAGKEKWFNVVDGGQWNYGDNSYPSKDCMFFAGTYYKHPLSIVAAKAALIYLKNNGCKMREQANRLTEELAKELNKYFEENNVPIKMNHFSSMFRFIGLNEFELINEPIEMELLFYLMIYNNVYTWERRICYLSAIHTGDIEKIVNAVKKSIDELRNGGFEFCLKN